MRMILCKIIDVKFIHENKTIHTKPATDDGDRRKSNSNQCLLNKIVKANTQTHSLASCVEQLLHDLVFSLTTGSFFFVVVAVAAPQKVSIC